MIVSPATPCANEKDRVLIIGATGFMGHFVAEASLHAGFATFLLLRPGPITTSKIALIKSLQEKGAIVIHGIINDKELMEKIMKEYEIDIVVSAVGGKNLLDQLILVEAMKSVKSIKRNGIIIALVTAEVCAIRVWWSNSIASWPYFNNHHPAQLPPPLDHLHIYGDGSVKAYFVEGNDIGKFTMKAAHDTRTLNKTVHFRPESNCYSINHLASLWEEKIDRTIPRITISEDYLLAVAAENIEPESVVASITHDIFIKGCQVNFSTDGPSDVEISTLYPEETFRSLEDCFEDFVQLIRDKKTDDDDDNDHLKGTKNDGVTHNI